MHIAVDVYTEIEISSLLDLPKLKMLLVLGACHPKQESMASSLAVDQALFHKSIVFCIKTGKVVVIQWYIPLAVIRYFLKDFFTFHKYNKIRFECCKRPINI